MPATAGDARIGELFDGLKWRLARDPEGGYPIPATNPPRYVMRSQRWPAFPSVIVVAYTFTDDEVVIHGVRIIGPAAAGKLQVSDSDIAFNPLAPTTEGKRCVNEVQDPRVPGGRSRPRKGAGQL